MITAALAFWNEPPANLERLVRSLDGNVANLVALDGRWNLMPGDNHNSPDEQHAAIADSADDIGLPYALYLADRTWDSQVAKRGALMHLAARVGHQPWTLVIDADEQITRADPAALFHALAHTDRDVALVSGARQGENIRPQQRPIRRIYRNATGVTVRIAHNGYCTATGLWLHGDTAYVRLEPAEDCSAHIQVTNHIHSRSRTRNHASYLYHRNRADHKAERWPRGLKT